MEFLEIFAKIRQALRDQDSGLLEDGMKDILNLPPLEQILSNDLIEILKCMIEIIQDQFPASIERMNAFADKIEEIFEDASSEQEDQSEEEAENDFPQEKQQFYSPLLDIQLITEKYYIAFANLMPKVQNAFIKFLKFGAPLSPELYQTYFSIILEIFENLPPKRLDLFSDFLDYGGNILPGEVIQEVSNRFFLLAEKSLPEKYLFTSYLGSFLLQFFDIYPDLTEDKIDKIFTLITNPEYYFRNFASDILKLTTQARPEFITPYFFKMLTLLSEIDAKILDSFLLTIRDLISAKGPSLLDEISRSEEKRATLFEILSNLTISYKFEISDFACEVLFDFLPYLNLETQIKYILKLTQVWKKFTEIPAYHFMLLQNYLKKRKLIPLDTRSSGENEDPEHMKNLLQVFETALADRLKGVFKNKQNYNRFN